MKIVKCPLCYDEREVDDNVKMAICRRCMETMEDINKKEGDDGN